MRKTTKMITRNGKESMQEIFDGVKYGFRWIGDWYEYDGRPAERRAMSARNSRAKELRKQGFTVTMFSMGSQLRSLGGIGSGRPHIEIWTKAYGLNATK